LNSCVADGKANPLSPRCQARHKEKIKKTHLAGER